MAETQPVEVRINQAVRDIERKESERRRRKAGLEATLARLEDRFNARHAELEQLRDRAHDLGDANREIETYILRLAELVEHAATGAAETSASLTLQLRTEMLPVYDRFEDVSPEELEAEDLPEADDPQEAKRPRAARRGRH
jgi:septal ring factor EnvC (AmiA/AmiB activator)